METRHDHIMNHIWQGDFALKKERMPSFEQILGEFVEGLTPDLPLVVAGVGVEAYLYTAVAHLLHDVAGVLNAWVLLATGHEEHVKLPIERLGVGENARHLFLEVEIGCASDATEHAR